MEGNMIWRIVHAYVFEIMVAGLTSVFKGSRLKNRHADCTIDEWFGLTGMDEFGFEVFVNFGHE
jgi:hypothetical protein